MFVSDVIKTRVWWPIAANQKKKKKNTKTKNILFRKKIPKIILAQEK